MTDRPRLLLSGGAGMVGRNILEHPRAAQWDVHAPGRAELDLTDSIATENYVRKLAPDIVIHAAGRVGGIQANVAHPVDFLVQNMDMGRSLIMAARSAGVKRLINLGSSCMYPRAGINPLMEASVLTGELEPTNEGYAISKIFAARLCSYIGREQPDYLYKTLIPCNLYGRFDKFDPAVSHLIPAVIRKVHEAKTAGADVVDVWGDGTARREFMYAGDMADAVLKAAEEIEALPEMMNIGVGADRTIDEFYLAAAKVIGWDGALRHDPSKPAGMARKQVDISLQTAWGWSPRFDLEAGIARTYDFFVQECLN